LSDDAFIKKYNVGASDAERLIADLRAHNTEEL